MFRRGLQHHLNALHIMTRLMRFGLSRPRALTLARGWEGVVHPLLYPPLCPTIPGCVAAPVRLADRLRRRAA